MQGTTVYKCPCAATGVLSAAKRSPELVHLLQLQAYFPQASLAGIVRGGTGLDGRVSFAGTTGSSTEASAKAAAASSYDDTLAPGAVPKMKDASTETPTHFVERHIDPRCARVCVWCVRPGGRVCAGTIGTSGPCAAKR